MFPILDPVQQHQKFPIFLVTLVGVPGESTAHGPNHKAIGNQRQRQIHRGVGNKDSSQTYDHTGRQNGSIQFIRAVPAHHKFHKAGAQLCAELPQPIANSVHTVTTLVIF